MQTLNLKASADDLDLSVAYIEPETEPKAIVQLVHGMVEHKERYFPFMQFLADKGFVVVIHDNRGHGASVKSPADLGYMYSGGWKALIEDVEVVRDWSDKKWPGLKRILFGHSMGSMIVRSYVKRYDDKVDELFVCGSPSNNPLAGFGKFLAGLFTIVMGGRFQPHLINNLSFRPYNKNFASEGYASAWICSDRKILEAYHSDPLCLFIFTNNGFRNLFSLMQDCYNPKGWAMKNPLLPVHFLSGELDPCRGTDRQHHESITFMRERGYNNITSWIYPGMRHEVLNETDHQRVWDDILAVIG